MSRSSALRAAIARAGVPSEPGRPLVHRFRTYALQFRKGYDDPFQRQARSQNRELTTRLSRLTMPYE
jgi:hypothetical protein